jgi:uncharacterized protein
MRLFHAALLAFAVLCGTARADVPVPPVKARVTDLTGTLSAQQKSELEARIAAYESRRGSQLAVLMLPTTKPEEIEQYSIRVAEAWKIGRKGVDDGLILIVAKNDRRLRIEVGYGLEGVIPDAMARRVIDERITPRFRDGDFYGGVRDGVEQLIKLAEGEKLPPPPQAAAGKSEPEHFSIFEFIFVVLFFAGSAGIFLKKMFGRFLGSLAVALALGLLGWLFFEIVTGVITSIVVFLISITNVGAGRGGFYSSSGSSSGSSGGSSSGGSWSGGGGSFGGGGSSGSW